ncbi:MAG: proteasome subunit alpha, partial [Ilumatobacteraceae bacterium]
EIYDRIAFAGVGKYNEFDQLRVAGIRSAELTGYQYSRDDVDARGLANDYAQLLGNSFTHGMKPMEVEILVAEVGIDGGRDDQIFHIMYDGTVIDRPDTCALGGESDAISTRLQAGFSEGLSVKDAIKLGVSALSGDDREIPASSLEIALLERNGARRCFRRLEPSEVDAVLQE